MNKPASITEVIRGPIAQTVRRHKHEQHDVARVEALNEAQFDNANARSGPGHYVPELQTFTAPCGCVASLEWDTDGESKWQTWAWDDAECGVIEKARASEEARIEERIGGER